jgi:probable F420-dependent oxidoreductase
MPADVESPAPPIRFGVNIAWMSRGEAPPAQAARSAEAAGFDVVTAADHVGSASPFVALAAAAAVTERVRLRSYVLDYGFWNPGLLARDVATLDAISGGRVEVGLGAGHKPAEHAAVGLPFPPYRERLAELAEFVAELRRQLSAERLSPKPVQEAIPVLIGAMSPGGLEVAVRLAEQVALTGLLQAPGEPPGTFRVCSGEELDERVALVGRLRERLDRPAGGLDMLVQQVVLDRDPEQSAAQVAAENGDRETVQRLLDAPSFLFARTAADAAAQLVRRSRRWGIDSWCVHQPSMAAMARVVEAVRG